MRWACLFPDGSMNVHAGDEDEQRRRANAERDRWNASYRTVPDHQAKVVRLTIDHIEWVQ